MIPGAVVAVITSFRPDEGLLATVDALQGQVTEIVVVDDGSGSGSDDTLERIGERGARVIRLLENSGIAAALNVGIRTALERGADFVVTFDQDSQPNHQFVLALVEAHTRAAADGHAVGPVVPEYFAGVRQVHRTEEDGTLIARHAIQSGMLLSRELLSRIGLMREDLFIDLVDTEFEMRCAASGRFTIAAPGLHMGHTLGSQYARTFFGRAFRAPGIPPVVTLSTPFRYYYRVRNRLVINRVYWRSHLGWIARDTALEAVHFCNALMLARPRRRLWSLYAAAIADARHDRMGRMPAPLQAAATAISWAAPPVAWSPRG